MPGVILVIENEPGIVDFLERGLDAHGFDVMVALDGVSGAETALRENVDSRRARLGVAWTRRPRGARGFARSQACPAGDHPDRAGEVEDLIAGLDSGGVDYLTKPFSLAELAARIRAASGRRADATHDLTGAKINVDLLAREVRRGGEAVRLSTTEFELLVYLMSNRGRVLPASRSCAPCGDTITTPAQTSSTSTWISASQAAPQR